MLKFKFKNTSIDISILNHILDDEDHVCIHKAIRNNKQLDYFLKKGFWVPQTNKNACITTQISRPQICSFKLLSTSYPHQININIGRFLDFNMFKHYYKTMFFMP
jgi:hypothetical protein